MGDNDIIYLPSHYKESYCEYPFFIEDLIYIIPNGFIKFFKSSLFFEYEKKSEILENNNENNLNNNNLYSKKYQMECCSYLLSEINSNKYFCLYLKKQCGLIYKRIYSYIKLNLDEVINDFINDNNEIYYLGDNIILNDYVSYDTKNLFIDNKINKINLIQILLSSIEDNIIIFILSFFISKNLDDLNFIIDKTLPNIYSDIYIVDKTFEYNFLTFKKIIIIKLEILFDNLNNVLSKSKKDYDDHMNDIHFIYSNIIEFFLTHKYNLNGGMPIINDNDDLSYNLPILKNGNKYVFEFPYFSTKQKSVITFLITRTRYYLNIYNELENKNKEIFKNFKNFFYITKTKSFLNLNLNDDHDNKIIDEESFDNNNYSSLEDKYTLYPFVKEYFNYLPSDESINKYLDDKKYLSSLTNKNKKIYNHDDKNDYENDIFFKFKNLIYRDDDKTSGYFPYSKRDVLKQIIILGMHNWDELWFMFDFPICPKITSRLVEARKNNYFPNVEEFLEILYNC